jgi:nicotinate-nucleotide adenylyltransferase
LIKKRIGIFGGTFNPPHNGHISAAREFINKISLDELLIIPAYIPPHKEYKGSVSPADRLEMCRIAFSGIEGAAVSDIEITRGGQSFTYLTLQELSSEDKDLFFLVGTDMFLTLDSWVKPEVIFNLASICYVRRETDESNSALIEEKRELYIKKFGARIYPVDSSVVEISSTDIREDILNNPDSDYVPKAVLNYIREKELYNDK